ncbi:MAG: ABC transporter ATP-binding protein/permease, partial [Candidatus Azobacteroides sp.]|nr:ABC transporter ATP-binding protein/permease [Candidatus Azobacteroides sp.]
YKGLIVVFLFTILSTVFSITGPKVMGLAVDKLFEGVMGRINHIPNTHIDYHYVANILFILLGLYLISSLFSYLQAYMMAGISQKIIQRMRNDISEKLHHLPLKFIDSKTHGEILSRVTNDIDTISATFQQNLVQLTSSFFILLGITAMMLMISPLLSLVTFVTLTLSIFVASFITKRSQKYFVVQQRTLGQLNGHVEEFYGGHNVVKAFDYEKRSIDQFETINSELYSVGWKAQFMSSVIFPMINFISNLTFVGICLLGGYMTAIGRISLGSVQAFLTYSRQFNQPIMSAASIVNVFQATLAAAERVFEILEEQEEIPDPIHPKHIEYPQGHVCFNQIKFSYDPKTPLIENVSLEAKPGQIIAIVGPTGAGKTTLVNLLMRFYELDAGSITIDDVNITDLTRKELHLLMGMVLQDTWLFKGTIRENIAYGKKGATDEEIVRASQMTLADDFIRTLPDGYNTIINEEGSNISQGQKQLLTIARAVLSNPRIMILDEATSSVDTRTEIMIQQAMNLLMKGRTSFVIAHRLSTIRDADCILVMNEGSIVEQGTHRELLKKDGFYAKLYNSQFEKN